MEWAVGSLTTASGFQWVTGGTGSIGAPSRSKSHLTNSTPGPTGTQDNFKFRTFKCNVFRIYQTWVYVVGCVAFSSYLGGIYWLYLLSPWPWSCWSGLTRHTSIQVQPTFGQSARPVHGLRMERHWSFQQCSVRNKENLGVGGYEQNKQPQHSQGYLPALLCMQAAYYVSCG